MVNEAEGASVRAVRRLLVLVRRDGTRFERVKKRENGGNEGEVE